MYALLDRARRLREKQERLAADDEARAERSNSLAPGSSGLEEESWEQRIAAGDSGVYSPNGSFPQGSAPHLPQGSQTTQGSPQRTQLARGSATSDERGPGGVPVHWRERLVEPTTKGTRARAEVEVAQAQKFDKLDDYLRGKLDPQEVTVLAVLPPPPPAALRLPQLAA